MARAGKVTVEGPQAVLVSNNVYGVPDPKPVMDWKRLGQIALSVPSSAHGRHRPGSRLIRRLFMRSSTSALVMDCIITGQKADILRGTPTISKTSVLAKKRKGVSGYDRSVP